MGANSFGQIFSMTTFGESHGPAVGVVIDGCPPDLELDLEAIQKELDRRKPGQSAVTTQRKEEDRFEVLSGLFEGKTTGAPICLLIHNTDGRPADYDTLRDIYRPSHADYTYEAKYGIRDHRGGGRSSARTTAPWVAAGAVAKQLLYRQQISVKAFVSGVGTVVLEKPYTALDLSVVESNVIRCPDTDTAAKMEAAVLQAAAEGDSLGGVITCVISGCPPGIGSPQFGKLHAELGKAMLNINAVKGFEIGEGFRATQMKGSEHNDAFAVDNKGKKITLTNHSGGIQGGISNGMDIWFRVAFKPVATVAAKQETVNRAGEKVMLEAKGRHDACVVPRAVPIVEAMAALVLCDQLLLDRVSRPFQE